MRRLILSTLLLPVAALGVGSLQGCPPPVTPSQSPSVSPTAFPTFTPPIVDPTTGSYSHSGIEVSGGSLFVEVKADGAAVKGATLRLYGPTLASVVTDERGQATVGPLAIGAGYRLVVEAPGYATSQVGNIEIKKNEVSAQRPNLNRGASLKGRILTGGTPVAGAVVSDGINSALTDASGNYALGGVNPGKLTITASKSRYQTVTRDLDVGAQGATEIDLALASATPVAYFDGTVASGVAASKLEGLKSALRESGWTLSDTPPAKEGVWVLVSPSAVPDGEAVSRITNFVAQGGKLVIFGEWGGYSGFHNPGANAIAHQVGLHFNPDLVRLPGANPASEWLSIRNFQPQSPAVADVNTIQLYSACSLFSLTPMTALAQTGSDAYRVQSNAAVGVKDVVMGGPFRAGKAIALGDSSGWLDENTDGTGASNVKTADNLKLIARLFDW
jgi:hypothetical protein